MASIFATLRSVAAPAKRPRAARVHRVLHLPAGAAVLVVAALAVPAAASPASHGLRAIIRTAPVPALTPIAGDRTFVSPLPTSQCLQQLGISCYSPLQYRVAYDLAPLYAKGITGKGRTIVIVDSFGSPTIRADLATFDAQWGFPDPELDIVPAGDVPPFNPADSTMLSWAGETTLDVEYAHAIAPGAKIVLVETPVAETEGVTGFPEMMTAEKSLIDSGVGDVISQSFGATENTFPGFGKGDFSSLLNLRYAFKDALAHHVTVLASSGDDGATNAMADGVTLYSFPVNSWPSSDPLVTSVGGSQLFLDDAGNRLQPDTTWNDGFGAGGGGVSAVFSRPSWQNPARDVVGNQRGTPDISLSAALNGGAWTFHSYKPAGPRWGIVAGTSEASPLFAGMVALADQVAGQRLGDINPDLALLGQLSQHTPVPTGLVDITTGNNSFAGVTGFDAGPGYDLATGWGTIDAAKFVPALAALGRQAGRHG